MSSSSRGGTENAKRGRKRLEIPEPEQSREEKLRILVEDATYDGDVEPKVLSIIKKAHGFEQLALRDDGKSVDTGAFLEAAEDQLRNDIHLLLKNKSEFAKRLVDIYDMSGKDAKHSPRVVVEPESPPAAAAQEEKKEEEEDQVPLREQPPANMYAQFAHDLNDLAERALMPLVSFTGMVAARTRIDDVRRLYAFRKDGASPEARLRVFDETVTTRAAFLANVRDAGPTLTTMMLTTLALWITWITSIETADILRWERALTWTSWITPFTRFRTLPLRRAVSIKGLCATRLKLRHSRPSMLL
jgi:hypothetical protein